MKEISEILKKADTIQINRGIQYGNSFLSVGDIHAMLFPDGIALNTAEDFSRYITIVNCVTKIMRYAQNMDKGGHYDSAIDLVNYGAILAFKTSQHDASGGGESGYDNNIELAEAASSDVCAICEGADHTCKCS